MAPRGLPTPSSAARPAIDSTSRPSIVTASRPRAEALRNLQPAAADVPRRCALPDRKRKATAHITGHGQR